MDNFLINKTRQVTRLRFLSFALPILAFIILFGYFLAFNVAVIGNNIDGSWQYTLSNLRHTSQTLGVNVFYNFGPLLERIGSYVSVKDSLKDFLIANGYFLITLLANIYVMFRFLKASLTSRPYQLFAIVSSIYLLFAVNNIDALFYVMLTVTLLAARKEKLLSIKLLMLAAIQLFSLYKFSFSLATLLLSPLIFLESLKPSSLIKAARNWFYGLGIYFVLYLGVTLTLSLGFFRYFYYGTADAIYYNEFLSLPFSYNKLIVVLFVLIWVILLALCLYFIVSRGIIKHKNILASSAIMNLAVVVLIGYFMLKESVVRSDGHLLSFTPLFVITLLPIALAWERKLHVRKSASSRPFAISLVAGCLILLCVQYALVQTLSPSPAPTFTYRIKTLSMSLVDNKLNYGFFNTQVQQTRVLLSKRHNEVVQINTLLDRLAPHQQVVVFGNTTTLSTLLNNSHQVLQSPFLQNYDAVPPQIFDPVYTNFLKQHSGDVLFLEETEASVNERVPAYQFNDTYQYIFHNYRLLASDQSRKQYLLKRISNNTPICLPLASLRFNKAAPEHLIGYALKPNQYIEMKATLPSSLPEEGLSLLIKRPLYSIALTNNEGGSATFRIEESTLSHGIVLNPLYMSYRDFYNKTPFQLSSFTINGGVYKHAAVTATLLKCSY